MRLTKKLMGNRDLVRAGEYIGNGSFMIRASLVEGGFLLTSEAAARDLLGVGYKENSWDVLSAIIESCTIPCGITNRLLDEDNVLGYMREIERQDEGSFYIPDNQFIAFNHPLFLFCKGYCDNQSSVFLDEDKDRLISAVRRINK